MTDEPQTEPRGLEWHDRDAEVHLPTPDHDLGPEPETEAIGVAKVDTTTNLWGSRPHQMPTMIDEEKARRWASEGIPEVGGNGWASPADSAPAPLISQFRTDCTHCGGRGFMPGINDLLKESLALLGDQGDEVIRMFYSSLLRANPPLMTLFPGDPTQGDFGSDHKGAIQRDRLLRALTALADLYDPADERKMAQLDQALASFGRHHAAFVRQDGTVKGATLEEYAAVKDALFATLISVAADKWKTEYTEAWGQAYDYAAAAMLTEQFLSGFAAPRFPRTS